MAFSHSRWFSILPIPAFVFWGLGGVAGAPASEDQCEKIVEHLDLLCIPGNQVSHFLLEGPCVFPTFPSISSVPIELFLLPLVSLARLNSIRMLTFPTDLWMLRQFLCIPSRLSVLISNFCRFYFGIYACPASCSFFILADLEILHYFLFVGMCCSQSWRTQVRVCDVLWEDMTRRQSSEEGCEEEEEWLGWSCIHLIYSWGVIPMCIHYQWCCLPNYIVFLVFFWG